MRCRRKIIFSNFVVNFGVDRAYQSSEASSSATIRDAVEQNLRGERVKARSMREDVCQLRSATMLTTKPKTRCPSLTWLYALRYFG